MHSARAAFSLLAVAALLATAAPARAQDQAVDPAVLAVYRAKLAEYDRIHGAYEREAEAYWHSVAKKRHLRFAKRRHHQAVLSSPPACSSRSRRHGRRTPLSIPPRLPITAQSSPNTTASTAPMSAMRKPIGTP